MPVILQELLDPPEVVMQGAQMAIPPLASRYADVDQQTEARWPPLIIDPPNRLPNVPMTQVSNLFLFGMINMGPTLYQARVSDSASNSGIRNNACICTPCGAIVPVLLGHQWFVNDVGQTTVQFQLTGVTRDATGAPLADCRVVVLETGRIQKDGAPIVGETMSDGSGNYVQPVPMNTAYRVIAYKPGSPDVAGSTRNDVVPVSS